MYWEVPAKFSPNNLKLNNILNGPEGDLILKHSFVLCRFCNVQNPFRREQLFIICFIIWNFLVIPISWSSNFWIPLTLFPFLLGQSLLTDSREELSPTKLPLLSVGGWIFLFRNKKFLYPEKDNFQICTQMSVSLRHSKEGNSLWNIEKSCF